MPSNGSIGEQIAEPRLTLTMLVYSLCVAVLVWHYLLVLYLRCLIPAAGNYPIQRWLFALNYGRTAMMAFYVLLMAGILVAYRQTAAIWSWKRAPDFVMLSLGKRLAFGIAAAILVSVIASPAILLGDRNVGFLTLVFSHVTSPDWQFTLNVLLLMIGVPLLTEWVFRGIVFRTLVTQGINLPAAVLATSLLSAYFSPVLSPLASAVFGAVSSILYLRTRTLLSSLVGHMFLTIAAPGASIVFTLLTGMGHR